MPEGVKDVTEAADVSPRCGVHEWVLGLLRLDVHDVSHDRLSTEESEFLLLEAHNAFRGRVQRIVAALTDILPRAETHPALADNDRPGGRDLSTVEFHAEPLTVGVAAERCGTACFLMGHILGYWILECWILDAGTLYSTHLTLSSSMRPQKSPTVRVGVVEDF